MQLLVDSHHIKMLWESMEKQLNSSRKISHDFRHGLFFKKTQNFEDWIIFMSMFNDILWKTNDENCISNAEKVENYAKKFLPGQDISGCRVGQEMAWGISRSARKSLDLESKRREKYHSLVSNSSFRESDRYLCSSHGLVRVAVPQSSLPIRDRRLPLDTKNQFGVRENVFGNQFSTFDSPRYLPQRISSDDVQRNREAALGDPKQKKQV